MASGNTNNSTPNNSGIPFQVTNCYVAAYPMQGGIACNQNQTHYTQPYYMTTSQAVPAYPEPSMPNLPIRNYMCLRNEQLRLNAMSATSNSGPHVVGSPTSSNAEPEQTRAPPTTPLLYYPSQIGAQRDAFRGVHHQQQQTTSQPPSTYQVNRVSQMPDWSVPTMAPPAKKPEAAFKPEEPKFVASSEAESRCETAIPPSDDEENEEEEAEWKVNEELRGVDVVPAFESWARWSRSQFRKLVPTAISQASAPEIANEEGTVEIGWSAEKDTNDRKVPELVTIEDSEDDEEEDEDETEDDDSDEEDEDEEEDEDDTDDDDSDSSWVCEKCHAASKKTTEEHSAMSSTSSSYEKVSRSETPTSVTSSFEQVDGAEFGTPATSSNASPQKSSPATTPKKDSPATTPKKDSATLPFAIVRNDTQREHPDEPQALKTFSTEQKADLVQKARDVLHKARQVLPLATADDAPVVRDNSQARYAADVEARRRENFERTHEYFKNKAFTFPKDPSPFIAAVSEEHKEQARKAAMARFEKFAAQKAENARKMDEAVLQKAGELKPSTEVKTQKDSVVQNRKTSTEAASQQKTSGNRAAGTTQTIVFGSAEYDAQDRKNIAFMELRETKSRSEVLAREGNYWKFAEPAREKTTKLKTSTEVKPQKDSTEEKNDKSSTEVKPQEQKPPVVYSETSTVIDNSAATRTTGTTNTTNIWQHLSNATNELLAKEYVLRLSRAKANNKKVEQQKLSRATPSTVHQTNTAMERAEYERNLAELNKASQSAVNCYRAYSTSLGNDDNDFYTMPVYTSQPTSQNACVAGGCVPMAKFRELEQKVDDYRTMLERIEAKQLAIETEKRLEQEEIERKKNDEATNKLVEIENISLRMRKIFLLCDIDPQICDEAISNVVSLMISRGE